MPPRWGGWTSELDLSVELFARYSPKHTEQMRIAAAIGRTDTRPGGARNAHQCPRPLVRGRIHGRARPESPTSLTDGSHHDWAFSACCLRQGNRVSQGPLNAACAGLG